MEKIFYIIVLFFVVDFIYDIRAINKKIKEKNETH